MKNFEITKTEHILRDLFGFSIILFIGATFSENSTFMKIMAVVSIMVSIANFYVAAKRIKEILRGTNEDI